MIILYIPVLISRIIVAVFKFQTSRGTFVVVYIALLSLQEYFLHTTRDPRIRAVFFNVQVPNVANRALITA